MLMADNDPQLTSGSSQPSPFIPLFCPSLHPAPGGNGAAGKPPQNVIPASPKPAAGGVPCSLLRCICF